MVYVAGRIFGLGQKAYQTLRHPASIVNLFSSTILSKRRSQGLPGSIRQTNLGLFSSPRWINVGIVCCTRRTKYTSAKSRISEGRATKPVPHKQQSRGFDS